MAGCPDGARLRPPLTSDRLERACLGPRTGDFVRLARVAGVLAVREQQTYVVSAAPRRLQADSRVDPEGETLLFARHAKLNAPVAPPRWADFQIHPEPIGQLLGFRAWLGVSNGGVCERHVGATLWRGPFVVHCCPHCCPHHAWAVKELRWTSLDSRMR